MLERICSEEKSVIQPVIAIVPRQKEQVAKLVSYCRQLDGTEIKVVPIRDEEFIPVYPTNEFASRQAYALRAVALAMKGQPFIWLEHDSVPLQKGWADAITREYEKCGRSFLLSSDSFPPHDITGAIGVYSGETHWLIPQNYPEHSWDWWMLRHLKPLIAQTPLIQHSYGAYDYNKTAIPHRFPRDSHLLRKEAVIFHRDKFQDLTRLEARKPSPAHKQHRFWHSGDLGDIIAALPAIRALGGGDLVIGYDANGQRESMEGARFQAIKPLLEAQPYIASVAWSNEKHTATHDFSGFRKSRRAGENLAEWQWRHLGLEGKTDLAPWLTIPKPEKPEKGSLLIVSRSLRYHNPNFPWKDILHGVMSAAFVGLTIEYEAFRQIHILPYRPTKDLLELAQLISGARLFIGNQSCPFWIAAGLGVPLVQETWNYDQNSVIPRHNALYSRTDYEASKLLERIKNLCARDCANSG